jgi:hypothetical protein
MAVSSFGFSDQPKKRDRAMLAVIISKKMALQANQGKIYGKPA